MIALEEVFVSIVRPVAVDKSVQSDCEADAPWHGFPNAKGVHLYLFQSILGSKTSSWISAH